MDKYTRNELRIAHDWADKLLNDEDEDRQLVLEGLMEMIANIIEGESIDIARYNRRYTRG